MIEQSLQIRANFRKKKSMKQVAYSVDRYHDCTDQEFHKELIEKQIDLHKQIMEQHNTNQNIQNVLFGL